MGRTATKPKHAVELPELDSAAINQNIATMTEHSAEVMAQFGDGLPYDRIRVVNEARFYMAQSAEAMLEAGKRLIVLKEHEPHGEFEQLLREQLGIPERTAQRMMQASLRFLSPKLQAKAPTLALLGKSKLFELLAEDDESLAELADGGTVAGLDLDDIERMSCRELRKALRDLREDKEAQGRLLANTTENLQNTKLELEKTRRQVETMTADQRAAELRQEVTSMAYEVEVGIMGQLREGFAKLAEQAEEQGADHRAFQAALIVHLESLLEEVRNEFDLPAELGRDQAPDWVGADMAALDAQFADGVGA
ncbi:DUF3102 domain-containing protein [Pseudomonas aeruginosa]|uniref:DUF3102 domain-containing protein n=1 Tax=Pseudomonas aeruginosa TaxID=287 RepID=UPI000666D64C|nr:DUF3102 domain-containing protein [Pseudomonas aeruginosa]EIU2837621.1 DUF3102 domain-containing protein [Pseudomonas aeruginosa]EIU2870971.1 DUF3102 domain-containing protein [Pseudomonas aeruginosa]EJT5136634.1 DUF3102 domain-containing protein [Pseudomonas aeruginosa]EKF7421316.1 DUF3102 domain-containing protein [Pseudomonas aeruginosa]EKU4265491.1 DUF3102 domain-containing protein [Pseudomonas aeruginosa]